MDGAQGDQSGDFLVQFFQGILSPDSHQLFNDSSCSSKWLRVRTRALEPEAFQGSQREPVRHILD